jgi:O-acetyl-ADP-ribose deacetylase (regulator of RNase III)
VTTVSLFTGDIADAPADAICTSTNVRLSLMMGTGASVRERGGWDVLRECEAIVQSRIDETGQRLVPHGAVYRTTAGKLPYRAVYHCIASDRNHLTSVELIALCTRRALEAASADGMTSLAIPILGSGHARMNFLRAASAIATTLASASQPARVVVVVYEPDRAPAVRDALSEALGHRFIGTSA